MDRNQFMRDLCELVNSDPNITASTYPANANHVSGLSYSVHRIPQNSESISKDNIFTGIQNIEKNLVKQLQDSWLPKHAVNLTACAKYEIGSFTGFLYKIPNDIFLH
jgi:hypothetical protein